MDPAEQHVLRLGPVVVVNVRMEAAATADGAEVSLAKGTALKTINDIDVALYVKASEAPQNEIDLLIWLAERLR